MDMRRKFKKGFTLIELLVVISIIGLLSSVVLVALNSSRKKARDIRRLSDIRQITLALELFYSTKGHYPGLAIEGVQNSGEFLGDDSGPIEQALSEFISSIPRDPLHDGVVYFYSYDPLHCSDSVIGACDCLGYNAAVLGINKFETSSIQLRKDVCSGGDMNLNNADYNIAFFPAP